MTREEAAQRTGHLLTRAMGDRFTATEMARLVGVGPRQIRRFKSGEILPHLDTLDLMLGACGYQLTISMKPKPLDEDEAQP